MKEIGLSTSQAAQLKLQYGLNELPRRKTNNFLKLLFAQFANLLSVILLIASVLSFAIGDTIDGSLILAILLVNGLLGFYQEYKASRELQTLAKMEVFLSRVIRDGKEIKIQAKYLVPGDLVILEPGDKVPADIKVIESVDLSINESSLTGESLPILKTPQEDDNLVFFGTSIVSGRGRGIVLATGRNTRFGKIAITLGEVVEEPTPLKLTLLDLARKVGLVAFLIALALFILRYFQGYPLLESFFTAIALLVAAVPEGLPAIITVILAVGVHRMYKQKGLIRKMSAIESLGATTVICTDKTGTLTKNEMAVKEIFAQKTDIPEILNASVFCNSASLVMKENHGSFDILGDSTEGALLLWAAQNGVNIEQMRQDHKIIFEEPFSMQTRKMVVVVEMDGKFHAFVKGAPETILSLCHLKATVEKKLLQNYQSLAGQGLRVLGFGYKKLSSQKDLKDELKNYRFLGFVGIADELRKEAKHSVQEAANAGIRVVMVTGDNELTAKAIGEEAGLILPGEEIYTGEMVEKLTDEELKENLAKIRIFARTTPEQKLRIIKAFQATGKVVAVTGDGVNDSLALKQAHVGVAMGRIGSDVAKEASDIVILDDNFSTIIKAVEEGRVIYRNIVKAVKFLMAGNLSEILLIIVASLANLPTPLLPVQILWINFVSDGVPALALAFDPASQKTMRVPPRSPKIRIINPSSLQYIAVGGMAISSILIAVYFFLLENAGLQTARSVVFGLMVVLQMVLLLVIRGKRQIFTNKFLLLSIGLVIVIQLLIQFYPPLQRVFKT